jgi:hypothetical protein
MINAFRVIWKTIKSVWEDMLLLVLMNGFTFICALPAAILVFLAVTVSPNPLIALVLALIVAVPTTIPFAGAWAALNATCNRVANGFAISWEFFFSHFKQGIWKWWRYILFSLAVLGLLILNFLWYPSAFPDQDWVPWVQGVWLAAMMFWVSVHFYVFPFYIEQETKSWRVAVRNAALVAGANPLFTFILLVVSGALVGVSLLVVPPLFVLLGWLFWVMTGNEAVLNRIQSFRDRQAAEEKKKKAKP